MAKFSKKNRLSETYDCVIDGETFKVALKKLSTVELVKLAAVGNQIMRLQKAAPEGLGMTEEMAKLMVEAVVSRVAGIEGLVNDEDQELKWSDMSDEDKFDLFDQVDLTSLSALFNAASTVGQLKEDEKKS